MEKVIILLAIGYAIGFYVRDRRAKEVVTRQAAVQQQEDERRRQYRQENDLSDPQNQLRFVGECSLKAVPPVNREAVRVLYAIDEWIKDRQPDWRFAFEVAMGGFIKTPYELPRVYRRVKLSEDEPYGREEENITLFA